MFANLILTLSLGTVTPVADIDGPPDGPGYPEGIVVMPGGSFGHLDVVVTEGATFDLQGMLPQVTQYDFNYFTGEFSWEKSCPMMTSFAGISGIAPLWNGNVAVTDLLNGVLEVDMETCEASTYINPLPILPSCDVAPQPCSPKPVWLDVPALPNDLAFGPFGGGWISDTLQGVVHRFEQGGGDTRVWLSDPSLFEVFAGPVPEGFPPAFGPNGIRIHEGYVYLAVTLPIGKIVRIPAWLENPTGADIETVYTYGFDVAPDNMAFALDGTLFVTLAGANAISVLDVDAGIELERMVDHDALEAPAGIAFVGDQIFGLNHAILSPPHLAEFGVWTVDADVFGAPIWAGW